MPDKPDDFDEIFRDESRKWKRRGKHDPSGRDTQRRLEKAYLKLFELCATLEEFKAAIRSLGLEDGTKRFELAVEAWKQKQRERR